MDSAQAPERDIDRIIAAVRQQIPEVTVDQIPKERPTDDDSIWWFGLPGVLEDVRVEQPRGTGPLLLVTEDDERGYQRRMAAGAAEAAQMIVAYLLPRR